MAATAKKTLQWDISNYCSSLSGITGYILAKSDAAKKLWLLLVADEKLKVMEVCCGSLCISAAVLYVVYRIVDRLVRIPSVGRHSDRYILVTGCDSGFGQGIARRLDAIGCHVFAACLTESGETELKKTSSQRLRTISLDVTREESVRKAFDYVKSQLPEGKGKHKRLSQIFQNFLNYINC